MNLSAEKNSAWESLLEAELRMQELSEDYVRIDHVIKRAEEIQHSSWRARIKRLLDSPDVEYENRITRLKRRQEEVLKEALQLDDANQKLKAKLSLEEYQTVNSPMIVAIRLAVWENIKKNFADMNFGSELKMER